MSLLTLLFALTLFVSATLLFWAQPLVGKMLLPLLGGAPAVWNTCMLFFQGMLLAGYAYALLLTSALKVRWQAVAHIALLALAALAFPFALSESVAQSALLQNYPTLWLLGALLAVIGLPFFVVSATGPLLQKWFSATPHPAARDPYFLYAASNLGSMAALLAFPALFEPTLDVRRQGWLWAATYGALALLTLLCALAVWRSPARRNGEDERVEDKPAGAFEGSGTSAASESAPSPAAPGPTEAWGNESKPATTASQMASPELNERESKIVTLRRRLLWVALAFIPSTLMLSVTTYISTDIAAAPLLWVIPLALYLLTLVLAFARWQFISRHLLGRLLAGAALLLVLVYLSGATEPAAFIMLLHLVFFFIAALACHMRLADDRPGVRHLAEFYLWVAVGGALGGLFNAIIAPLVFNAIIEYPLAIILACMIRPHGANDEDRGRDEDRAGDTSEERAGRFAEDTQATKPPPRRRWLDVAYPLGFFVVTASLSLITAHYGVSTLESVALVFGAPLILINHLFRQQPVRFALALGAVMLGGIFFAEARDRTLRAERNFFGTLRVARDAGARWVQLCHGSTIHGRQFLDAGRRCVPLTYYHPDGPLGQIFALYHARPASPQVAVVGLGAGAMAAYARPAEHWTFYEINPAVVRIAQDPQHFTYLSECARAPVEMIVGDARLRLREAANEQYGLIVLDAFSSDAIPLHLLTREALRIYLSKLAEGGIIALHISNRSLNLHPALGALARDAGLVALGFDDWNDDPASGKAPSQWVVMARAPVDLGLLVEDRRWTPLPASAEREVWTDDFSNIVGVLRWF